MLPPWDSGELRDSLEAAIGSESYKDGQRLMEDPALGKGLRALSPQGFVDSINRLDAGSRQRFMDHDYCVYIDLLRSLAPTQVEEMRQAERLPFTKLTGDQQSVLLRLILVHPAMRARPNDSYVGVEQGLTNDRKKCLMFAWTLPNRDKRDQVDVKVVSDLKPMH